MNSKKREREIYKVTLMGSFINVILVIFKFIAGILGGSAAMIADAVHSLSDLLTDMVVLIFVKISNKPQDKDHDYGHGKYETLATVIIGIGMFCVGVMILYDGIDKIIDAWQGAPPPMPGLIALIAALVSILLKEWSYQFTVRTGRRVNSQAVIANAWHNRSDALSSLGTAVGIGGAILLGHQWTVLDPLAAVVVSFFILHTAYQLIKQATGELLEKSLSDHLEDQIVKIAEDEPGVSEVHHLRTRRIGNQYSIEMHVRMPGDITLYESHLHATNIEHHLREVFGQEAYINLHVEPVKIDGKYIEPFIAPFNDGNTSTISKEVN